MSNEQNEQANSEQAEPTQQQSLQYVGFPQDAPTTFADSCVFVTSLGLTVRLQFVEFIPGAADSTSPGMKVRYVHNVVMPLDGFNSTLDYFNSVRERTNKEGADAIITAAKPATEVQADGE